jgi:hypothetical protein
MSTPPKLLRYYIFVSSAIFSLVLLFLVIALISSALPSNSVYGIMVTRHNKIGDKIGIGLPLGRFPDPIDTKKLDNSIVLAKCHEIDPNSELQLSSYEFSSDYISCQSGKNNFYIPTRSVCGSISIDKDYGGFYNNMNQTCYYYSRY